MHMLRWLTDISQRDQAWVGAKALHLAQVVQAGFVVPAGFCITTRAYDHFVAINGLEPAIQALLHLQAHEAEAAALHLQESIRAGRLSASLCRAVRSAVQTLAADHAGPLQLAVRSSATAEDLPSASFAGQQTTLLGVVGEERLLRAIQECWASMWAPRALVYRIRLSRGHPPPSMAVLVQPMVQAQVSGVAFSQHPYMESNSVLIEAAYGLGETVVGGHEGVDRYQVDRNTRLELQPPAIAPKRRQRVAIADGGVQIASVPLAVQDVRALSPEQVREVADTVMALERHLNCAQDMEWAYAQGTLHVLQTRPITTGTQSFFTDILPGENRIWTSGFLNERFTQPVSPLGWSIIQELLEELAFRAPLRYLGLRNVDELPITRLFRGHPYVNLFVFQTLYKAFPEAFLPEDAYRYFPDGRTELRQEAPYPRSLLDPRLVLSMLSHFRREPRLWSPWHNDRVWADYVHLHGAGMASLASEWQALQKGGGDVQRAWEAIERAQQLNRELLAIHRWSLTDADLSYTLLRRLLRAWTADSLPPERLTCLVTGLPNKSLELNREFQRLAAVDDKVAFSRALDAFLSRYGHRSFHLDIYYPTFADDPQQVLELVDGLREATGGGTDRTQRQALASEAFAATDPETEAALQAVRSSCGRGPVGRLKAAVLGHVLRLARRYMPLREDQRFHWQETLAWMRKLFLFLGQSLADSGIIQDREDVFFLTRSEIGSYVGGRTTGKGFATLAQTRHIQFKRLCREFQAAPASAYPAFLQGNRPLPATGGSDPNRLQGRGVSPGLARGRAVILFSPDELDRVRDGDVLVARSVDPGWTPVFALLAGLVTEHGGQLSHAAVVAREYGLPTVTGIPGVTQTLRDGDQVLVDGLTGTVTRLEGS